MVTLNLFITTYIPYQPFVDQTQVVPSYSAAGPERKSGDEVLPFDEWAVALHPNNLDLEAASPQSQTRRFPLREDNCDDLQTAQSVKATVLRAARLKFMRETADYVSAGESSSAVRICYRLYLLI